MSNVVIQIESIGKQYKIGVRERYKSLRDTLTDFAAAPYRHARSAVQRGASASSKAEEGTVWALRDVSLEVQQGEVVGIIGRNGAGKSTLLKILSRITEPTEGKAIVKGRVSSMLEVGTGFHPELTGRENIYLNASILGMRRREIEHKLSDIIEFAGVGKFIDTPVKRFSSGMQMRLAFAVAAHLDSEILLVDEVLAVGDAAFQQKCLAKMDEISSGGGRTVLFVSHHLATLVALCPKAHWLDAGRLVMSGPAETVVGEYWKTTLSRGDAAQLDRRTDRTGTGWLRATEVRLEDLSGNRVSALQSRKPARIVIHYAGQLEEFDEVGARVGIVNTWGERLFICANELVRAEFRHLPRNGALVCELPDIPLYPGLYEMNIILFANKNVADKLPRALSFQVVEGDSGNGSADSVAGVPVEQAWSFEKR